jgi:hypothetical protein
MHADVAVRRANDQRRTSAPALKRQGKRKGGEQEDERCVADPSLLSQINGVCQAG